MGAGVGVGAGVVAGVVAKGGGGGLVGAAVTLFSEITCVVL